MLTSWISVQSRCCPSRDGRHLESFRKIWVNVVLAKIVALLYLDAKYFLIINITYEMYLTVQLMHLNCRKDRVQSPTRKEG